MKSGDIALGNGLLSDVSQQYKKKSIAAMDITYIPEERIAYNPLNEDISKNGIEELAQLIVMNNGLEQPLVVREYTEEDGNEDYDYVLLTGERRLRSIRYNKEKGIMTDYRVPCVIKELEDIPLPLTDDLKEEFAIAVSNKYRDKTDGDLYLESIRWQKIYKALKDAGEKYINFTDTKGNIVEQKSIVGKRVRELVAEEIGVSQGTEQKIEEIEKRGVAEIKSMLLAGRTNLETAHAVSKLEPEDQKVIAEQTEGKLTKKNVRDLMEKKEEKVVFTKETLEEDMKAISNALDQAEIRIGVEQKKRYDKAIKVLKEIFGGN